jgi:hypothetical protein
MEEKYCKKCDKTKPVSEFRVRVDKRIGKQCTYPNNQCKECDNKEAKTRYEKLKDNPEFKEKNRKRAINYHYKEHEKVLAAQKEGRERAENKERRRKYEKENRQKIQADHRLILQKEIDNLSDSYVICRLKHFHPGKSAKEIRAMGIIEEKRKELALLRLEKRLKEIELLENAL